MIEGFDVLTLKVLEEVEACIGCNDCMLACPLPEKDTISIAMLNAAVHAPLIDDLAVEAFVTACTQCQQCVPVCPADLSRADMVLINKQKVEDVVPDREVRVQRGDAIDVSTWTIDGLADALCDLPLFAGVDRMAVRRLVVSATLLGLAADESVLSAGRYQERFLVVLSGTLRQHATGPDGVEIDLIEVGPGAFLGEMAVLADRPEPYSVTARFPAEVLAIPKAVVQRVMRSTPSFQAAMDTLYAERGLETYAKRSAVLGALPVETHADLLAAARQRSFRPGEVVVREGDPERAFTLVLSGFLKVHKRVGGQSRVLVYYREGDDFGALSVLDRGWTSRVTIEATTVTHVLEIPAEAFRAAFAAHPKIREALLERARQERDEVGYEPKVHLVQGSTGPVAQRNTTHMALDVDALLDKGILKGHQVLAIDLTRCVDCNNCVDACGRRHGTPRLERRGLQLDTLLFPSACRHCEDPVCLLCSVNGIVRRPDGEISIVADNCIGCGGCAERCPYDNIQMHRRDQPNKSVGDRIANLFSPSSSHRVSPFFDGLVNWLRRSPPERDGRGEDWVAHKCDLCADHGDQACVTACPTGAAFRFDPIEIFGDGVHIGLASHKGSGDA